MKTPLILAGLFAILAVGLVGGPLALSNHTRGTDLPPLTSPHEARVVAANGMVEGARPEAALRPEVPGILRVIHLRENQPVAPGQILAELANETHRQQVALAAADLEVACRERARAQSGERPEARRAAEATEAARRALYNQAKADYERSERTRAAAVSAQQRDADYFRMQNLKAAWDQAAADRDAALAPRPEDLAVAEARVQAAEARLKLAQAELDKTRLVAPFAGVVLQVHAEPGEAVGPQGTRPVFTLADLSHRRVRAYVEELDIARVKPGQAATVTADGLPNRSFSGRVALVLQRMGRRAPQSDAPDELKDVYFREVMIDLDEADDLPLNLRVQVRIHDDDR